MLLSGSPWGDLRKLRRGFSRLASFVRALHNIIAFTSRASISQSRFEGLRVSKTNLLESAGTSLRRMQPRITYRERIRRDRIPRCGHYKIYIKYGQLEWILRARLFQMKKLDVNLMRFHRYHVALVNFIVSAMQFLSVLIGLAFNPKAIIRINFRALNTCNTVKFYSI